MLFKQYSSSYCVLLPEREKKENDAAYKSILHVLSLQDYLMAYLPSGPWWLQLVHFRPKDISENEAKAFEGKSWSSEKSNTADSLSILKPRFYSINNYSLSYCVRYVSWTCPLTDVGWFRVKTKQDWRQVWIKAGTNPWVIWFGSWRTLWIEVAAESRISVT